MGRVFEDLEAGTATKVLMLSRCSQPTRHIIKSWASRAFSVFLGVFLLSLLTICLCLSFNDDIDRWERMEVIIGSPSAPVRTGYESTPCDGKVTGPLAWL
ncbi:uncharacterized protein BO97DRAFT_286811 [Aspergillus homomorphus CBS 101889]|uniref:Uncharacterized protein n=1 Tax=Aspergillus homomorphus (strain CBS 101889) TaxID=1450537 RepID=A0A395HGG0_ASPHC|nr:hypothetical protein BO97DRAFT_286811 [Aspergillus homomorphus CBS 101889]RAL06726.1 hypothetical protein BO97DRAFT_286811 [Aspergillus homomorphus CBS 101889]